MATRFLDHFPSFFRERLIWIVQASLGMRVLEDLNEEVRFASHILAKEEAPVAFDFGTIVGAWSLGLLSTVTNAQVLCFEPNPAITLEELRNDPRAKVISKGVSNRRGAMSLYLGEH